MALLLTFVRKSVVLEITAKLFFCPECGKQSLSIHRKTYEKTIIVFCDNCHLNSSFEPSIDAYYDADKSCEEFKANYHIMKPKIR